MLRNVLRNGRLMMMRNEVASKGGAKDFLNPVGINKVILIGHIGKEPETKNFEGGSVTFFPLATNEYMGKDDRGVKLQRTTWHNVVIYNTVLGNFAQNYTSKGSMVYVEGTIRNRVFKGAEGDKNITEIVLPHFRGDFKLLKNPQGHYDATKDHSSPTAEDN